MKRTTKQWLASAVAAAALATGCAGRPAPRPAPTTPIGQAGLIPNTAGSTTGDADACAIALGNAIAGTAATGWTGTVPGPNATAVTPGGPAAGPTGNLAGTPGATGYPGTTGYAGVRHEVTANGVLIGNVALVALPTMDSAPITPGAPGMRVPGTAPGAAVGRAGMWTPTVADTDAISRIRAACTKVTEIRIVSDAGDRARLAAVTMAMRKGMPITTFLDDLVRINRKATTAGGGVNTTVQPGEAPGGTMVAPPAVPGPTAPVPAPGTTTP